MVLSKAKLSHFRKFLQKKTRIEEGCFLIEGWHLVDEALKAGKPLKALIVDVEARREAAEDEILNRALSVSEESYEATASQVNQISDTKASQGVMALVDAVGIDFEQLLEQLPASGPVRLVLLDEVGDPGNCGSIVRAADWFGMDGVIFGKGCAELENGKTARATMGGLFHLPVAVGVELPEVVARLRERGVRVYSTELDETAESLAEFSFPELCALVIGNEARGVSAEVSEAADGKLFVPRFGAGESLNAAMAASVCLGQWRLAKQ